MFSGDTTQHVTCASAEEHIASLHRTNFALHRTVAELREELCNCRSTHFTLLVDFTNRSEELSTELHQARQEKNELTAQLASLQASVNRQVESRTAVLRRQVEYFRGVNLQLAEDKTVLEADSGYLLERNQALDALVTAMSAELDRQQNQARREREWLRDLLQQLGRDVDTELHGLQERGQ